MKSINQQQRTYQAGNNRIDIATGNHPDTLQPIYGVSIQTEKGTTVETGFGDISEAVKDTVNNLELPADQFITFPIL